MARQRRRPNITQTQTTQNDTVGLFEGLFRGMQEKVNAVAATATQALGGLQQAFSSWQGATRAMDKLALAVVEGTAHLIGALGRATTGAVTGPIGAAQGMAGAVALASPATAQQFGMALENITAVLGRVFQPVLEAATVVINAFNAAFTPVLDTLVPVIRQLAGVWAALAAQLARDLAPVFQMIAEVAAEVVASLQPVFEALGPMVSEIAKLFAALAQGLAPVITGLAEFLAPIIRNIVQGFTTLVSAIRQVVEWLTAWYRRALPAQQTTGGMTIAARQANFVGALELGRQLQQRAFGNAVSQLQILASIQGSVQLIANNMGNGNVGFPVPQPVPG